MQAEIIAIGTELLLGQVVDTNSSWMGEQLALSGIACHYQTKVGDNHGRIVAALRLALERSDVVICCGGLGPTQDDITREAIAEVAGVGLVRDEGLVEAISTLFSARGRVMSQNNLRQADVPEGAVPILQERGTAPGLICPVGPHVVYAVPGVPHEMRDMMTRAVIPDIVERSGQAAVIASRTLRTWGLAESTLAETLASRIEALDALGNPTIAFLASGIEGIKVRITASAAIPAGEGAAGRARLEVDRLIATEETEIRDLLGDTVFGVDDETMEAAVGRLLEAAGRTLGVAESLTGGLMASRLVAVPGASNWFRGGIVSYATEVKQTLLGVPPGPVVSAEAAEAMALGAARALGASVALAVTGVAGPAEQEGQPVGTVWVGIAIDGAAEVVEVRGAGDRERIRQFATINALDLLRRRLLGPGLG